MIASISVLLALGALGNAGAVLPRTVAALDPAGFAEAQQRDAGATRAFSGTSIKTSDGKCLFVDELSGDSRTNLTPIQLAACDGSKGQQWDIITKGKHNDQVGQMLIVNTLTQACMNFDPRRAAGNTVIMFSCGGRADGSGDITESQLFAFDGGSGPLSFAPKNAPGTCLAVTGAKLDQAGCSDGAGAQSFTFGGASSGDAKATAETTIAASATKAPQSTSAELNAAPVDITSEAACEPTVFVTVTRDSPAVSTPAAEASSSAAQDASTSSSTPAASSVPDSVANGAIAAIDPALENPTTPVSVSRAGGVLQPTAAAESQVRDDTATRAFSAVQLKSGNGLCLFVDPTAGDFRQNLIPVQHATCDSASPDQKFDLITKGVHNDRENTMAIVSSVMQGCLSFDARRAAGDTVQMFSCGGRADGNGQVTDSQLYSFNGTTSFTIAPENAPGTCLGPDNAFKGKLSNANCDGSAEQTYSVVQ